MERGNEWPHGTDMLSFVGEELQAIREAELYRSLRSIQGASGPEVRLAGRRLVNLCSNGYLGLAGDARLKEAAARAARLWGAGAGASRLISGNLALHEELEARIASFEGTEAALLFNSGYHANIGTAPALVGEGDVIFSDALNHASLIDACRLSRAGTVVFPHLDVEALEGALRSAPAAGARRKLVLTEGIFSMDGDVAPLPKIAAVAARLGAILMVDDAHGTGVMGLAGRGTAEHFGLTGSTDIHVRMGTLGKALGSFGAFVAGRRDLIEYLRNRARSFIYTTALPPAAVGAALAALDIVESEPERLASLRRNARFLHESLATLGYRMGGKGEAAGHILPVLVGEARTAVRFSEALAERGVLAQAIRPPTVPAGTSRIRVAPMATHTREQLDRAVDAFAACRGIVP